jgi:hypothetical protein
MWLRCRAGGRIGVASTCFVERLRRAALTDADFRSSEQKEREVRLIRIHFITPVIPRCKAGNDTGLTTGSACIAWCRPLAVFFIIPPNSVSFRLTLIPLHYYGGNMNIKEFRVPHDKRIRLAEYDTAYTNGLKSKKEANKLLKQDRKRLADLQDVLYAHDRWSLLLIFQAMDAAGKDGTIKHVMSGINPQGCQVFSFKAPSAEELDHGYMWRYMCRMPERGRIGIFNRSYYEEVLVVRVHPEILAAPEASAIRG